MVSQHAPRPDRLPAIPESPPWEKSKEQSINWSLIRVCLFLEEIRWYLNMLLVLIACQRFQKVSLWKKAKKKSIKQLSRNIKQSSKYSLIKLCKTL